MFCIHQLRLLTRYMHRVKEKDQGQWLLHPSPQKRIQDFRHPISTKNTNLQKKVMVMVMLGATQVILWYGRKAKSFNIAVGKVLLVSGKYLSAEKCREFSPYSTWSNMQAQGASACNFLDVNYRYRNHPSVARISNLWTDAEDDCRGFCFSLRTRDSNSK